MSRHSHRPLLARQELGDLLHFGVGASVSGLVNHAALNADNFVVGRWLGAAALGMHSRAYNLMNLPYTYSAVVLSSILFPAFAQVQGRSGMPQAPGASIPWTAGVLWQIGEPGLDGIRTRLPAPVTAIVDAVGRRVTTDRG